LARCRRMARAPQQKKKVLGGCGKLLLGRVRVPVLRGKLFSDENKIPKLDSSPGPTVEEEGILVRTCSFACSRVEVTKLDNNLSASASFPSYVVRTSRLKMLKMEEPPRSALCAPFGSRHAVVHIKTVRGGRLRAR
jgi:hypothetical protein